LGHSVPGGPGNTSFVLSNLQTFPVGDNRLHRQWEEKRMDDESAVDQWAKFASLQERISKRKVVNHKAWALEDQADAFLEAVARGSLPAETERRDKWLDNLETNRQKKHRHRSQILQQWIPDLNVALDTLSPIDRIIVIEQ